MITDGTLPDAVVDVGTVATALAGIFAVVLAAVRFAHRQLMDTIRESQQAMTQQVIDLIDREQARVDRLVEQLTRVEGQLHDVEARLNNLYDSLIGRRRRTDTTTDERTPDEPATGRS